MDKNTYQLMRMFHGALIDSIAALLFKYDIDGIVFDDREVEYEAALIVLKLPDCKSADDCQKAIHAEMMNLFEGMAKPLAKYEALARDVWQTWLCSTGQLTNK